jgi:acyl-CoA thioester hydrolase
MMLKLKLLKATVDFSRRSFINEIWKNGDTLLAVVTVDGAWMNTIKRKLAVSLKSFQQTFAAMPKSENYNK